MGRASRRKKYRAPRGTGTRGRKNWPWFLAIGLIVVVGVGLIVASKSGNDSAAAERPTVDDHFHASINVDVCGTDIGPPPEFEQAAENPSITPGVHSHGDGLIHIHPHSTAETGNNATVGLFFDYGGWSVSEDSLQVWDGTDVTNGDPCENLDGKPGVVRWSLNGEEQSGNVADYVLQCGLACGDENDQIVIAFLPEDEEIPPPPEPPDPVDLPTEETPGATGAGGVPVPGDVPTGDAPTDSVPTDTVPAPENSAPPAS